MAITGVLRPGFVQIRVLDMEAAITHYVDRIGLNKVAEGADGRVYLKSAREFDHHSIVLRKSDRAGMDLVAFKVSSDEALTELTAKVEASGVEVDHVAAGEQLGVGRRVGFTIPSGHRFELYAEAELSDPKPQTHNPEVWDIEPHGMAPKRFDHVLLYGPEIEKVEEFFTKILGFTTAERVDLPDGTLAIWLTCSIKAHDIAFVKHPEPNKLHHISFQLENWNSVGHAADIIARYDLPLDMGPTRHGITQGQTIYFFDPSGNRDEVFTGGYDFYPDNPPRVWDERQIGKAIFYYERQLNEAFLSVVT
jgi:catechol 2,3-dioxygenase